MGYICVRLSSNAIKKSQLHRSYSIRRQASLFEYISELCNNATYTHIKNALTMVYIYTIYTSKRYPEDIIKTSLE